MDAKQAFFTENEGLFPPVGDWSRLLVGCRREDYSASRVAHAVEDCNAHLLNLNVTSMGGTDGDTCPVVFDIRVNLRNTECVSRSLERYGFTVLDACSCEEEKDNDTKHRNYDNLMRYLNI